MYSLLMRANKLETVLSRDRWLVGSHLDGVFFMTCVYAYIMCVVQVMLHNNYYNYTCTYTRVYTCTCVLHVHII